MQDTIRPLGMKRVNAAHELFVKETTGWHDYFSVFFIAIRGMLQRDEGVSIHAKNSFHSCM